jgi:hypothetical protein
LCKSLYASAGFSERIPNTENGLVTATSIAKGRPPLQLGRVTSPGRRSVEDRMLRSSTIGDKSPSLQKRASRSRTRLCLTMVVPFLSQQAAWSPSLSTVCMQRGQGTSLGTTGAPSLYAAATRKTCGFMIVSAPSKKDGTAVTHAPACGSVILSRRFLSRRV